MPSITYIVPPFYEFVQKELKGYDFKMVEPSFWNFALRHLEVKTKDQKTAVKVYDQSVTIIDRSLETVITDLADKFEKKYSQDGQVVKIQVECLYRKDESDYL